MALTLSQPVVRKNLNRSLELALAAAREAEDNRGQEVLVLDMREQTTAFDYFVGPLVMSFKQSFRQL